MRKNGFLILLFVCGFATAQDQFREVWHDGDIRSYHIHLPEGYAGEPGLPLVINLHGFGSNGLEQLAYTRFNNISDFNNFIVVYPNGLEATIPIGTGPHWNAGFETGVDDTGFIDKLIDLLWNEYRIDLSRVYATGMSNGGFMSYTLACELSDRIAAVASVTGSMTPFQQLSCDGEYTVPVLQFHGTSDPVVDYDGSEFHLSIPALMDFWAGRHDCGSEWQLEELPDDREGDNSTVTRITYPECDEVVLYRINDGGHTWPNGAVELPQAGNTNRDIDASSLIWSFFSGYEHPDPAAGRIITSIEPVAETGRIFPTMFDSHLILRDLQGATVVLMDQSGKIWKKQQITSDLQTWETGTLASGLYLIRLQYRDHPPRILKVIKL